MATLADAEQDLKEEPVEGRSSFSSYVSSEGGSLYPGDEHHDPLLDSIVSHGSLWKQYSLIHQSHENRVKSNDLCVCCNSDSLRHGTLKILFLLVVAFGLTFSGLALRFSVFSPQSVLLTGGDQSLLPISTYFNQEIAVTEECSTKLENSMLYVLPQIPEISEERFVYSDGTKFLMPSWSYQYWGLNLLKGSEVTISVCADLHLQFYILKGEKKLKAWKQTTLFSDFDYQSNIPPKKSCEVEGNLKRHHLTVSDNDIYYILFSSSVGWRFFTEVTVVLHFNRTYYDVSGYKESCSLSNCSCTGKLKYASEDIALVQTITDKSDTVGSFETYQVTFAPVPRWSFYLKYYGILYLVVIVATAAYSVWRFCILFRSKSPAGTSSEKEPLLGRGKPHSYSLRSKFEPEPWMIVKKDSTRDSVTVEELEVDSVLEASIDTERRPSLERRYTMQSNFSNDSEQSMDYMTSQRMANSHNMIRDMQLMNDQQLLDSVMTSAGVSAI